MPSNDRRAAGRRRAWGRGPIILKLESLERRALMTAGGTSGMNLRFQPTIANTLPDVSNGTADQLNTEAEESTTLPISQQREVLASGFIKTTLPAMLTATK